MIIENGFGLLKTRLASETIDVEGFEFKYKLSLPPLYRLFVKTFHLGEFKNEKFFHPDLDDLFYCAGPYYYPKGNGAENIGITGLFNLEEVFENWHQKYGYGDETMELGLIRIASLGIDGGLFVGNKENNLDVIILEYWDKETQFEILAENIFEFMQGMVLATDSEKLAGDIKFENLYKNWGDPHWLVKKDLE
jgi:hypothetical protein